MTEMKLILTCIGFFLSGVAVSTIALLLYIKSPNMRIHNRIRKSANSRRKREFSKIILCVIAAADVIVVSLTFVLMVLTRDLTPLPELLIGMFGLTTIAVSFYYNKAKAENQIKLKKENGIALKENDFESDE